MTFTATKISITIKIFNTQSWPTYTWKKIAVRFSEINVRGRQHSTRVLKSCPHLTSNCPQVAALIFLTCLLRVQRTRFFNLANSSQTRFFDNGHIKPKVLSKRYFQRIKVSEDEILIWCSLMKWSVIRV